MGEGKIHRPSTKRQQLSPASEENKEKNLCKEMRVRKRKNGLSSLSIWELSSPKGANLQAICDLRVPSVAHGIVRLLV